MKMISLLLVCVSGALSAPLNILDMTHLIDENTQLWGSQAFPSLTDLAAAAGMNATWAANNYCSGEHVGTHIDAPAHMKLNDNQQQLHEMSLERLFGPAVRIDVREKVKNYPTNDYPISQEDLEDFEKEHGAIPQGAIVFACTGWGEKYGVSTDYWGPQGSAIGVGWSFPSFGEDAAEWLVKNRKIRGIAADTASCDVGNSATAPAHQVVLSRNIWCMEHVAKSCELPPTGATAYAFPIKMKGGSGTPLRVVATWGRDDDDNRTEDDKMPCNSATTITGTSFFLLSIIIQLQLL